jgi:hypothetical protein
MYPSTAQASKTELKKFGLLMAAMICLFFGLLIPLLWEASWPRWPWIAGVVLAAVALLYPPLLRPVYRLWGRIGLVLGWVNTRILLGLVFYLLFTPVGLIMRRFRDPMARHFDPDARSYRQRSQQPKAANLEKPF